jgi:hypothetical protein
MSHRDLKARIFAAGAVLVCASVGAAEPAADDGSYWSLKPLVRASAKPGKEPPRLRGVIDREVRAALRTAGLKPSPPATDEVILRRLHLDLTGLPPPPRERGEPMKPRDWERLVDELLASPAFGERWGRHWLDVARFAESNGRESNLAFPHAWRYRDYVIDAFNADTPFDRFILEQIAGDLLPAGSPEEEARLLIATGFLALGAKGLNEQNSAQFAADLADEQLDTTSRAFLASSIACARCHDHKTDPFTMRDYYALAGIFTSTRTFYGNWIDSENNNASGLIRLPGLPGQLIPNKSMTAREVAKLREQRADLDRQEAEQNERVERAKKTGEDLTAEFPALLGNALRIYWSRGGIDGKLQTVDDEGRALPLCMGAREAPESDIGDAELLLRGELDQPAGRVPRGFPAAIRLADGCQIEIPASQSGRLELARWIAHPSNPLTARVMANRVWRWIFGAGLVRTVDTFGADGEPPSHSELLDLLADAFIREGWSVKKLVREMVLSRTYRQSSMFDERAFDRDPDNRLLWRANKKRLEAEVIRDCMLAVSGALDSNRRPGSLVAEFTSQAVSLVAFNAAVPADLDGSRHRSVYLPVLRDHLPDALAVFDFAEPSLVIGDRDVTNVPVQALYLMNAPFVQEQAAAFAARLRAEAPNTGQRIRLAFGLCYGRRPEPDEETMALDYLRSARESAGARLALDTLCQALLAAAEFRLQD